MSIPVLFLSIGVDFNVNVRGNYELSFPPDGNSLNPVKLAVEVNFQSFNLQCQYTFSPECFPRRVD